MLVTRSLVYLLVGFNALAAHADRNTEGNVNATGDVTEGTIDEDQRKVYDECRNPDYKKYVKCLMRPKRHGHHTSHGDGSPDTDPAHCLEACLKKCDHDHHLDHECEKKCSHCTKKTRHRHQIITEYETECVSGNCSPSENGNGNGNGDGLRTTNITTNIGINNIINPYAKINGSNGGFPPYPPYPPNQPSCCPPGSTCPNSPPCSSGSALSIPIVPQISLVPQITYGVGIGAAGGCAYNQWLCIQQPGVQLPSGKLDCSGCGNPVLRYRCDVNCYATHTTATKSSCTSPDCVGGST
ncbi:hypothetical protein PUN28_010298 [Cardiocondyla obscurior]|uniref:Uncharacterized protein n=1 Tax=Cardiocondyla obscurior TaxID=286306 RepID=A0AAW2FRH0_9HYME